MKSEQGIEDSPFTWYWIPLTQWRGEAIEAVRMGLRALLSDLQGDPHALETCWLSVITFDETAKQLVALTAIDQFNEPDLVVNGRTSLGAGLELMLDCTEKEIRKTTPDIKGDYKPLVFIMTDGYPTDSWEQACGQSEKTSPRKRDRLCRRS